MGREYGESLLYDPHSSCSVLTCAANTVLFPSGVQEATQNIQLPGLWYDIPRPVQFVTEYLGRRV